MDRIQKRDGGYGWVVCFSFFIVEILLDGIRFSYGLFFVEFLNEFKKTKAETAWIGGVMIGVYNLAGPIFAFIVNKLGYRTASFIGSIIGTLGLIASSFATEVYHLYFSYGALQGFGFGLVFLAGTVAISRYFLNKRALAIGISYCGSGVGLFALPPVVRLLFDAYSWRGCLFILAGLILNCCVFSCLYRPLNSTEVIVYEINDNGDKKESVENGKCATSENGQVSSENQAANPLLCNPANRKQSENTMNNKRIPSPSFPRSFADMRKEQLQGLKEGSSVASLSQRSINKAVLSQSIFGSNASFNYIIENRKKAKHSILSLQQANTDCDIIDTRKHFKNSVIESMFPKELVTNINFLIMMTATFLIGVPSFIPFSMLPDFALSSGSTTSQASWLLSAMGIGGTVGRIGAGLVSDMSCVHRLTLNSVCYLANGAALIISAIYPSFEILIAASTCFGVFFGAVYVVQPVVLLEYTGEEYISEIMGVLMCVYGVSQFIGSPLAGWIFDVTGSYKTSFLVAGILFTVGGFVNFLVLCTKSSRRARTQASLERNN